MIPGAELFAWGLLAACGGAPPADAPAAAPQSTRQETRLPADAGTGSTPRLVLDGQVGGVVAPVRQHELAAWSPEIAALAPMARAELTGSMNLVLAPCAPCMEGDVHLARCVLDAPAGCENLPELVDRMRRVAAAGGGQGALRAVATYGDAWTPAGPGTGAGWPDPDSPVHVELWVDPGQGLWRQAAQTARDLATGSAERDHMGPLSISVRLLPTWTVREQPVREGALPLHRAVAAADRVGQGVPLLLALAAQAGDAPDLDAAIASIPDLSGTGWTDALAAADADLAADAADARAIGLRAAPSWRIDGYRLRGAQSLPSLMNIAENQWLDHLDTLPAALLAIDAPTPGPQP